MPKQINSAIKKKKKIVIDFDENYCPFLTSRKNQCSIKTTDGAYCKRHANLVANKQKDAAMAKDKETIAKLNRELELAANKQKDAVMAKDKETIAKLKRELELAAANARQATRDFEDLALQKMMIEKFDEMMGKFDTMNMSSASK